MIRSIIVLLLVSLVCTVPGFATAEERTVHENGIAICSTIIREMTEGRVGPEHAQEIALAIAHAANRQFGKVTCGDMWLYMAIVHVESGFRRNIVNQSNCLGLFQVHGPSWARKFGLSYRELLDIHNNAESGLRVFRYYLEVYGDIVPALSAYNSDHPRAALGYARTVLAIRKKIRKRYSELYRTYGLLKAKADSRG